MLRHRRSIRLKGHDYASAGAYFLTVCIHDRANLFGQITDDTMTLNAYGQIVADGWRWLARHHAGVVLDEWIVMPNHLHGILVRDEIGGGDSRTGRGGSRTAPTMIAPASAKPLGRLIGAFKTVTTKQINQLRQTPGTVVWQRNYWERVIRDDIEMNRIRAYIARNVDNWATDSLNVAVAGMARNGSRTAKT